MIICQAGHTAPREFIFVRTTTGPIRPNVVAVSKKAGCLWHHDWEGREGWKVIGLRSHGEYVEFMESENARNTSAALDWPYVLLARGLREDEGKKTWGVFCLDGSVFECDGLTPEEEYLAIKEVRKNPGGDLQETALGVRVLTKYGKHVDNSGFQCRSHWEGGDDVCLRSCTFHPPHGRFSEGITSYMLSEDCGEEFE